MSEIPDADVIVAGAGPAGIAVAVAIACRRPDLADAGRIVCYDKARFPREKPCGGGLTGHAHAALDALGLSVRVPAVACCSGQIVYGAEARTVTLERSVDVVRREEFDADLVAQARARGIRVVEGEGVASHEVDGARGLVSVTTSQGRRLNARVLVAADGAGSRIRKHLLAGDPHLPSRPLRLFKAEIPAPRQFGDQMIYDFSPMDSGLRGYVWLFPVEGGRLNVGAMHTPTRKLGSGDILKILGRTLARHGVTLPAAVRVWPAWPYAPRARLAGPHILCVGDAAGIDALTGEGIAVGLEHGPIAAAAIQNALVSDDFRFTRYGRAVREATVGRELALDRHLARRLYGERGFRFWLSLVMFDRRVLDLYASRVCGSEVLADKTGTLLAALARHTFAAPLRLRRLKQAQKGGRQNARDVRAS
ncbi:MAG: FAD-dependent monooxygenase [Deltaproteobacteria bacterium]|nr:FAD-dependent monooxygenase [Deltaproteobacteria bacterium]